MSIHKRSKIADMSRTKKRNASKHPSYTSTLVPARSSRQKRRNERSSLAIDELDCQGPCKEHSCQVLVVDIRIYHWICAVSRSIPSDFAPFTINYETDILIRHSSRYRESTIKKTFMIVEVWLGASTVDGPNEAMADPLFCKTKAILTKLPVVPEESIPLKIRWVT